MYCPKCLNNTLAINSRGVVHLMINGKKMDSGRFLFNFGEMTNNELIEAFTEKIESFFKWYSNFQNQDPIALVELYTSDLSCEDGCPIPIEHYVSVIDLLIKKETLDKILNSAAEKYSMTIELNHEKN
ncbi:hypothetical protein [Halobacteriovorax sp. JY17]|uniref:hypothetical protein n=1 Tax=Halobacteriovorax sp. JY17 TaxID=2014617 RepID=UPI000C61AF8F|nr:hypothetical protein [Halobacteriovorax sp. JY17]PIK16627.1 MAG: hypothetical protein CES88_07750 [Halobacteriovorax sp. JY17]